MVEGLYDTAHRWTPTWIRELARTAGARVGCQIGRLPSVELLGTHLKALFRQLEINCVLDVGAHVGQYGRFLRNIGYTGRIVSFEPVLANFERLEQLRAGDANWTALRMALGNREGTMPMNVACVTQFSSFLSPSRYSLDEFSGYSEVERTEVVAIARLDRVFSNAVAGLAQPRVFLKLDTQGYDINVLEGAGASLTSVAALQSELSVKPLYEGMTDYLSAMSYLNRRGFEVTGVFPVVRDKHLRIMEFDCVMAASPSSASATSR
jgi:FkbM family methyltransferase